MHATTLVQNKILPTSTNSHVSRRSQIITTKHIVQQQKSWCSPITSCASMQRKYTVFLTSQQQFCVRLPHVSKSYVFRKVKTSYNFEWRDQLSYCLLHIYMLMKEKKTTQHTNSVQGNGYARAHRSFIVSRKF